jgi:dipeptidyl aminopeptidase/acylaminoacyl peptidase
MKPAVLVLALTGLVSAQPVLTPEMVAQLRAASGVRVSDDGRWTAYQVSQPRLMAEPKFEDGAAYTEVHLLDSEGRSRPFLTARTGVSQWRFSPDNRAITFLSKRTGDEHQSLYRIPLEGGEPQRILEFATDIRDYALAPKAQTIAFLAAPAPDKNREKLRKLGFQAQVFEEDWQNVVLYFQDGKGAPRPVKLNGSVGEVHWSPDGGTLAVTMAPNPGVDADLMFKKIQLLDGVTGQTRAVVQSSGKLGQIAFSPDGKHLSLLSGEDINDPDNGRLWVADTATGKTRDLWPNLDGRVTKVEWIGPARLRALVWRGLNSEVWDLELDGQRRRPIVPASAEIITDFSSAADGSPSLYVADSATHPGEVMLQQGLETPRRVTHLNPQLDKLRWAKQEAYSYKARDGQTIQGVLIHPLQEQAGQRYPLIMWVHGGPEAQIHNGWLNGYSQPGHVAAARGFASFYPNYRGSIGRGVAFSKLGQGDPAGREFDDLVDGVDALIAQGLVDRSKVGVTGGSYGGYATAWCSTFFSDRFAAGVMSVGISDKISKSGTTDIPEEEFLVHARKRPWDNFQFFLERSPIRHVQKHRTPLLIMHGKDDPRVHPSQSLELYRYLKMMNQAPVRLVLYPGEGHGNRKAAARYDFHLRMLQWMEHYLKGPGGTPPAWDLQPEVPKLLTE